MNCATTNHTTFEKHMFFQGMSVCSCSLGFATPISMNGSLKMRISLIDKRVWLFTALPNLRGGSTEKHRSFCKRGFDFIVCLYSKSSSVKTSKLSALTAARSSCSRRCKSSIFLRAGVRARTAST